LIEPGGSARRRLAPQALPRVQRDVMVIATGGKKCRGASHGEEQVEPKQIAIEGDSAVEIRNLEMHVTDMGSGGD
jgi:hypothetical protein